MLYLRLVLCIVLACVHFGCLKSTGRATTSVHWAQADRFNKKYLRWVLPRYPVRLMSEAKWTPDIIKEFDFTFRQHQAVDIDQARRAIVPLINEFVEMLAGDEEIHPYLAHHEYEKLLSLDILFFGPSELLYKKPYIAAVALGKGGVILYMQATPDETRLRTIHKETYEEALERLGEAKTTGDEGDSAPNNSNKNRSQPGNRVPRFGPWVSRVDI